MKVILERAALLKCLGHVQSVVEKKTTMPILSNVLIEAVVEGDFTLSVTDTELTVVERISADVHHPGKITVSAHMLHDIVRKMPDGAQVEIDDTHEIPDQHERVRIQAGRSHFMLSTLPAEDFPLPGDEELPTQFSLSGAQLRFLIDQTRFAIATEETRYYLNGIYLHSSQEGEAAKLRAVATDGHRLAQVQIPLPEEAAHMPGVIIHRKTVTELQRLLEESDDPVKIALSENRITFQFASLTFTSRLIDGTFPDYERVIPTGNDKIMQVDCLEFSKAVDRVVTIVTERNRPVKLALSEGLLTLSASSPDSGSATEEMPIIYTAEAMEIGFNSNYLRDIAEQIKSGEAEFIMADANSPVMVRDLADPIRTLYVLMPLRV